MEGIVRADSEMFTGVFPKRAENSNKYDYGRVLMICGSEGYSGAACLAAEAAVRAGAGLVTLCVPRCIYQIAASKLSEAIVKPLPCGRDGMVSDKAIPIIIKLLGKTDVCLAGCGLGRGSGPERVIKALLENCRVPLILDADGINALIGNIHLLSAAKGEILLTPHDGELSRIADISPQNGETRIEVTQRIALGLGVTLVRKGHESLTASKNGRVTVNSTGNPGLAKGGSGDVLAGIIAALAARKIPLYKTAAAGVYLHGLAGDICARRLGEDFMTPSDVIMSLGEAIKTVKER